MTAILDEMTVPIALAPLAGGPSTPELAAAVTEAGGLGFIAAGYLSAAQLKERIADARALTTGVLGVNLFVPGGGPAGPPDYQRYVEHLVAWAERAGVELGEPVWSDDDWVAKVALLLQSSVDVVSFTFGCPAPELIAQFRAALTEVWVTVTTPEEATQAAANGADVLVVQGAEAGGHRGSWVDRPDYPIYSLLPLLALIRQATDRPLIASGGIATAAALAAVQHAGARAAQIGTAFLLAPEAGTPPAHRTAIQSGTPTVLTRAFTGRLARGIRNEFILQHEPHAPVAYPEIHYVTAPMRRQARTAGNADLINLWAGEAHQLAQELPAAEIVRRLAGIESA